MNYKNYVSEIKLQREPCKGLNLTQVQSSDDVFKFSYPLFGDALDIYESFYILLLNNANKITAMSKISQGGTTGTVIDLKIICHIALNTLAQAVICVHNHPSGQIKPSQADLTITKKINTALATLDIKLLDHIIITADSYYSFADSGQL